MHAWCLTAIVISWIKDATKCIASSSRTLAKFAGIAPAHDASHVTNAFWESRACIYWVHFFGKQAAARGICVLRPRCACGAVGVRASLAPRSGRAAGIEWLQSGDSLGSLLQSGQLSYAVPRLGPALSNALRGAARRRQPVAATAKAWCLRQQKLAKGITCHAPSQGSFASTFFPTLERGLHAVRG